MNVDDRQQLNELKNEITNEVNKDIALAISSFKIWLLATVLSNVVLIGLPALFVFFTTQTTTNAAYDLARDNKARLDGRSAFIDETQARVSRIEEHLADDGYVPLPPMGVKPR